MRLLWAGISRIGRWAYVCGFCGAKVAEDEGYYASTPDFRNGQARIYICPNCTRPTLAIGVAEPGSDFESQIQVPSPSYGEPVESLPSDVNSIYDEARRCMTVTAYAATVMLCRKLLMHVAVERGATPGQAFAAYVDYLVNGGYVAPTNKTWVDRIRSIGNEANHELAERTEEEAKTLLEFSEMLLKTVYEYPERAKKRP